MISWVTGQHVLAALLDTGTTTDSSSVLEDPLSDGTEEREPVKINNNITMSYRISLHAHVLSHIALDDDVHGNSPLDSTIIHRQLEVHKAPEIGNLGMKPVWVCQSIIFYCVHIL